MVTLFPVLVRFKPQSRLFAYLDIIQILYVVVSRHKSECLLTIDVLGRAKFQASIFIYI